MFGMKLKSWMEAHLGRPKHKSASQAKNKCCKESFSSGVSSSTPSFSGAPNNPSSGSSASGSSASGSDTEVASKVGLGGCTLGGVVDPGQNGVDESGRVVVGGVEGLKGVGRRGEVGKVDSSGCPRSSVSVSVSNSILLGSFTNNLSSPDTGYSTDGYSPKSVYPALSFESSGKSTPKSSYTISSLVSSELLHSCSSKLPTTASISSGSCCVQNELELDSECISRPGTTSGLLGRLDKMVEVVERSSKGKEGDGDLGGGDDGSPLHSIKEVHSDSRGNQDSVTAKLYSGTPVSCVNEDSGGSHSKMPLGVGGSGGDALQGVHEMKVTLRCGDNSSEGLEDHHHRCGVSKSDGSVGDECNSSSSKGFQHQRKVVRTSVLGSSCEIIECNPPPRPTNPYSICSPRKERTKIKTNPWISMGHSNANNVVKVLRNDVVIVMREDGERSCASPPPSCGVISVEHDNANNNEVGGGVKKEVLYRISNSGSASDSGKGSLEPGTNRNSTESSYLLSDSASPRNSIISQEAGESRSWNDNNTPSHSPPQKSHNHQQSRGSHHHGDTASSGAQQRSLLKSSPPLNKVTSSKGSSRRGNNKTSQDVSVVSSPPEVIVVTGKSVTMVDKETDILSDWANTDEDGEDEMETDGQEGATTPTPSTPTDGGRAPFPGSRSPSTATDIDFGDSSAATAASSSVGVPSSSGIRDQYTHNINTKDFGRLPPSTCYQPIQVFPKVVGGREQQQSYFGNQSESPASFHHRNVSSGVESGKYPTMMSPEVGIPPLSALLYSDPSIDSDYLNANLVSDKQPPSSSSSSHALARGALGFLRKIFKKGSCSTQRTSPGSDRVRIFRKGSGGGDKEMMSDYLPVTSGLRSPLLTADALGSHHHPLANRQATLHGYFLTPTPNAFRRRSGAGGSGGTESSDSKSSSKNAKSVKTDIIRLPGGALSPTSKGHHTSSSSTASSSGLEKPGGGVFCVSNHLVNAYEGGLMKEEGGFGVPGGGNSTSGSSSVHSMSTSASGTSGILLPPNVNGSSRGGSSNQSGSHHHHQQDNFYSNSKGQSFAHLQNSYGGGGRGTGVNSSVPGHVNASSYATNHSHHYHHQLHQQQQFVPLTPKLAACYGEQQSPRLQSHPPPVGLNAPGFNNYSPIHRLVVTGGNHLLSNRVIPHENADGTNLPDSPKLPPRSCMNSQPIIPPYNGVVMSTFTPIINRSVHHPGSTSSPLINHRQQISCHNGPVAAPVQPSSSTFGASPILGNPRYQYIASSNQNSPILNGPKRISGGGGPPPVVGFPYPSQGRDEFPGVVPQDGGTFSRFSPVPPPRLNNRPPNNPLLFTSPSVISSSSNVNNSQTFTPTNLRRGSVGVEVGTNVPQNVNGPPNCSQANRQNVVLSRSQSYQTQGVHYYASPVLPQNGSHQRIVAVGGHPQMVLQHEQPLLMRTHLHNQNIRLNNFLLNKQRLKVEGGGVGRGVRNSESFQDRIYETVDSEDDEDEGSDDDEGSEGCEDDGGGHDGRRYGSGRGGGGAYRSSKSRRSKEEIQKELVRSKRPPLPMALFGPNTFLSETETRLLEADREADRKYKRLINEAEALLREISAVKSQQPWAHRNHELDRFQMEDCPQSDPLRRKAYDCWALRRLQQELAGCCASPPVLHRSRMNLQSPSTPTSSQPYPGLSLAQDSSVRVNFVDSRSSGHF